ncbi:hypothetical protein MUN82_01075 [Hymenobacter aerilatus]|uniref:phosphoribosylglycinamide formyltransferase 1 n=1 Tax=Hymenobacter aerilatus TaxID=2932251 RepID=A0A8T9T0T4_9BACT|nr:formyltransferase family protein [Hymenobacter aerilatus]UOR05706.1 hypothetical protein MUN82_01075 [Hymenobacter aerilatus]
MKHRIAFLVSGGGGTLRLVHQAARRLQLPWEICLVLADRPCGALAYADDQQLPVAQVTYSRQAPEALQAALQQAQPDVVVLAFDRILDAATLALFPGRFINVHYSLLPSFAGLVGMKTVEQARAQQVRILGATCHEVTEQVDGGPVLAQCALPVDWQRDAPATLHQVLFRGAGLILLQSLLHRFGWVGGPEQEQLRYLQKTLLCSPPLTFDAGLLTEELWQQVSG